MAGTRVRAAVNVASGDWHAVAVGLPLVCFLLDLYRRPMAQASYHLVPLDGLEDPIENIAEGLYDPYKVYDEMGGDETGFAPELKRPTLVKKPPAPPPRPPPLGRRYTGWSPVILRLPFLFLFVAFLFILTGLAEVFVARSPYSAPTSSSVLFLWTYGPPALVVIIDWIWELYDLQIKIMQPWSLLSRGTLTGEHPMLLDYRSINYFSAIWYAFRHLHFVVLLSYIGYWIAAVASVMSTSLWTIQDLTATMPMSLALTAAMPQSPVITAEMWGDDTYLNFFFGHQMFNLSRPRWMTDENIVMEPFDLPADVHFGDNVTQYANTYGYSATLNCTSVSSQYVGNITTYVFDVTIGSGDCIAHLTVENDNAYYDGRDSLNISYYGSVMEYTCPGDTVTTTFLSSATLLNGTEFESTALSCVPQYLRHTVATTVPPSINSPLRTFSLASATQETAISGGDSFLAYVNNNTYTLIRAGWADLGNVTEQYMRFDPWYSILLLANNVTFDALMDPDTLSSLSQSAFAELWGNFAAQSLFTVPQGDAANIQGTVEIVNRILQARSTSVRVLQAMLVVMVCCAMLVYFARPKTNLPLDPSSLAGIAALLRSSDGGVMTALYGTGEMTEAQFMARIKRWRFSSGGKAQFMLSAEKVRAEEAMDEVELEPLHAQVEVPRTRKQVWRPILLHPIGQSVVLGLVAATIAILESLYWYSKAHHGLSATPLSGINSAGWSYVAPFYVAILGLLTQAYGFSARAIQPYSAMAKSPQPVQKSIGYNPAAHTGISLLGHSLKYRSLMGVVSAISLLTVPFMKIAVAGLLVSSSQPMTFTVELPALGTFNTTSVNVTALERQSNDVAGAWRDAQVWSLTQIPSYGLLLPAWTTTREAIGPLDLSDLDIPQQQNVTLRAGLPVLTTNLTECAQLSADEYLLYTMESAHPTPEVVWPANATNGEDACYTMMHGFPPEPGYFGQISAGDYNEFCRDVYFVIYGYSNGPAIANITDITIFKCSTNMTLATMDVTLGISGDSNTSAPTVLSVDDSSAGDMQVVGSLFKIARALQSSYEVIPGTFATNNETENFDGFFQVLALQNTSTPLSAYLDPDVLLPAAQELWSSFWAVWTGSNMRIPVEASAGQNVSAQLQTQQPRVVQQPIPTRVLEALLGAIFVCGIISAFMLRNSGGVLPKAPYSIGAQMSLLADSSLLDLSVMGEELDTSAISEALSPYRFQLGWENDKAGNPRFGVDIE